MTAPPRRRGLVIAVVAALVLMASVGVFAIVRGLDDGDGGSQQTSGTVTTGPAVPPTTEAAPPTGEPACGYKIGFLGPLSGDTKAYAESVRNGAALAVKKYNDAHPGCEASLVSLDSNGADAAGTRTAAQQAIGDTALLGVVGPMWQSEVEAAQPLFEEAGLPSVTPTATLSGLSYHGWDTFHRIVAPEGTQAGIVGSHLVRDTTVKKVYLVHDNTTVGQELVNAVSAKAVTKLAGTTSRFTNPTELAAAVAAIKASGADTVYFGGFAKPAASLVKALSAARVYVTVYTGAPAFDGMFITEAGDASSLSRVTCSCVPPEKITGNFIQEYRSSYNQTPSFGAAEAYDATSVFLAGISVGVDTREDMLGFVSRYDRDGLTGRIKFQVNGDPAGTTDNVWAFRVQGGYFVGDQELSGG